MLCLTDMLCKQTCWCVRYVSVALAKWSSRIDTFLYCVGHRLRAPQLGRSKKGWVSDLFFSIEDVGEFIKTPPQLLNKIDLNGQMDMKTSKSAPRTQQNKTAWNSVEQVVALWIWTPKMRTSKLGCRLLLRDLDIQRSAIQEVGKI